MNEIQNNVARTPELIAAEINNIKNEMRIKAINSSIEIGRKLVEAKALIEHGEWGKWLKESVNYSQRTANNLMKIFEEYGADQITLLEDNTKSQAFANLGYSQALALLELDADKREKFVEENNVDEMSTRELQKAIKEKNELEEKLRDSEKKVQEEHKAWKAVSNSYDKLEKANKDHDEQNKKLKEQLEKVKNKNKEDLVNKEVEIENLNLHIKSIEKQLSDSKASGNEAETEKLQTELQAKENLLLDANNKIQELKQQLESKPIDVKETIVEKVPKAVEKELNELREKAKETNKDNKPVVMFSIYFDELVKNFSKLLEALTEITDEELNSKYKGAVSKLINKMDENL